jgi:hypothetical protein
MTYRPNPRTSRLALLLAGLAIVAGEVAASFLIDYAPLEIRFPEAASVISAAQQLDGAKKILFFGSSRSRADFGAPAVAQALRDGKIDEPISVLNAAVTAGDAVAIKFLTDKLLAAGVRPAIVVIEVLPETISRRNAWLRFHLARQFHWPDVWKSIPDAWRSNELAHLLSSRIVPLYLFRSEFQQWAYNALDLSFKATNFQFDRASNTPPPAQTEPNELELSRARIVTARKRIRDFKIGGLAAQSLENLIMRYREVGTGVVLLAVPLPTQYRNEYSPPVDAAFLNYMRRLREKYTAEFFDSRHRVPDHFFKARYYLTADGQTYFSQLVAREVLLPLLTRERNRPPEVRK